MIPPTPILVKKNNNSLPKAILITTGDLGASLETYQVGAHFEALDEGVLLVPLDPRCTQVGFNLISVQVCYKKHFLNILWNKFATVVGYYSNSTGCNAIQAFIICL